MKTKEEYAWLTSATHTYDEFLGPATGLPLPFLLRHGVCSYKKGRDPGFTLTEEANCIMQGGRHFYLASVDANGQPQDMTTSFFLPRLLLDGIVVGDELLRQLQSVCNLDDGIVFPIDPQYISAHSWKYSLPPNRDSDELYRKLFEDLEVEELPGDDAIVRELCDRFPTQQVVPQMNLILAPWLSPRGDVSKKWHRDIIVISAGKNVTLKTKMGSTRLSSDCLRKNPIINFEGFLLPRSAASLFSTDDQNREWPVLTCKKEVIIEA